MQIKITEMVFEISLLNTHIGIFKLLMKRKSNLCDKMRSHLFVIFSIPFPKEMLLFSAEKYI